MVRQVPQGRGPLGAADRRRRDDLGERAVRRQAGLQDQLHGTVRAKPEGEGDREGEGGKEG